MTRTWKFGRVPAMLAIGALAFGTAFSPTTGNAAVRAARANSARGHEQTAHASAALAQTKPVSMQSRKARQGAEVQLQQDGYDGTSALSILSYATLKAAFGVRLTIGPGQGPFTMTAIRAVLDAGADGNLTAGENIEFFVFADAGGSGNPANAVLIYTQNDTVMAAADGIDYPLNTPLTFLQGDIYIFVADHSTDADGSSLIVFSEESGATPAHRSFITTAGGVTSPTSWTNLDDITAGGDPVSANLIIRAVGTLAADGTPITGGGQPTDATLNAPRNLTGVTAGNGVVLTFQAPAPPALTPVEETEPNNSPAAAQAIQLNVSINGDGIETEDGAPGGFAAAGETEDVEDWYSFTTNTAGPISISLHGFEAAGADFDLFLYPAAGPFTPEDGDFSSGNAAGEAESISISNLPAGNWVIGVDAYDPGVPDRTDYILDVAAQPAIVAYNVYCGTGEFTPSAATFIGTAGPAATSFTVQTATPGATYLVTAVYGDKQSGPSNRAQGAACEGGPTISSVNLKLKKNGKLKISGSGFTDGLTVLINNQPVGNVKKNKKGTKLSGSGLASGQPISSVVTSGSQYTIQITGPGGACSQFTGTAP